MRYPLADHYGASCILLGLQEQACLLLRGTQVAKFGGNDYPNAEQKSPPASRALGHGRLVPLLHIQHFSCSPCSPSVSRVSDSMLNAINIHGTSPSLLRSLQFKFAGMKISQNLSLK